MPVKIRLSRHGRKARPFYHIVVADSRAPRDGRYIERIGSYNPNTNPASIDLNFDSALSWVQKGAQPTDTARAILSYKGVMLKNHLLVGVKKGALTEEQAEEKFAAWVQEKGAKIQAKIDGLTNKEEAEKKTRIDAESKISEDRAAAIAKKKSDLAAEIAKAEAGEEETTEVVEATEEVVDAVETKEVIAETTKEVVDAVETKEVVAETTKEVVDAVETKEVVVETTKEVVDVVETKEEVTETKEEVVDAVETKEEEKVEEETKEEEQKSEETKDKE